MDEEDKEKLNLIHYQDQIDGLILSVKFNIVPDPPDEEVMKELIKLCDSLKEGEMAYTRKVTFTKTGLYGCGLYDEDDVYTVEEFKEFCGAGAFIDYDGFGHPVKDGFADACINIKPSRLSAIPEDATHIVWYNR